MAARLISLSLLHSSFIFIRPRDIDFWGTAHDGSLQIVGGGDGAAHIPTNFRNI